jgi:hypothetical protein
MDNPVTGGVMRPIVQSKIDTAQPTAVTFPTSYFSSTGNLPIESGTPVARLAGRQTEMSRTVDRAEEDTDTVKAWKSAVNNIKWVKDTVNPTVNVCPLSLFSTIR